MGCIAQAIQAKASKGVVITIQNCGRFCQKKFAIISMEHRALKNVSSCMNANIYSYLETSDGRSSNLYQNVVPFLTPVLIRHLWQLEAVVFLHWCLMCVVLSSLLSSSKKMFCYIE
jgi:hypothetical protein